MEASPSRPMFSHSILFAIAPEHLVALGAAATVMVVPGHFNLLGAEIAFEAEKALLLRSLALVVAGGLAVTAITGDDKAVAGWRAWTRHPIVIAALVFAAASLLASLLSIAPVLSWWGGYERRMGMLTLLADIVVFLALLGVAGRRPVIEALVEAVVMGSAFPALYGAFEAWTYSADRVLGTAGNPVFLAGYLVMVWPYTAARAIEVARQPGDPSRLPRLAAYTGLLGCQTIALISTAARGPLLGLTAGLLVTGILYVRRFPLCGRRFWRLLGLAVVLAGLAAVTAGTPVRRVASLLDLHGGTTRMRVVMWGDAVRALEARPSRLLTGYGPETTALVLGPYQSPEVSWIEGAGIYGQLDRAHNAWLDSALTTGMIGLIALLLLWLAAFRCAARLRQRAPGDLLVAAIIGSLVAHLVDVQFSFETVATSLMFWVGLGLLVALTAESATPTDAGGQAGRPVLARLRPFLAVALALMLVSSVVSIESLRTRGLQLTPLALPMAVAIGALAGGRDRRRVAGWWRAPAAGTVLLLVLAGITANIDASRATVFARRASDAARVQDWHAAQNWYASAIAAQPGEPFHVQGLVLVLLQEARAAADEPARLHYLQRALSLAERRPASWSPDSIQALAQVHLTWADLAPDRSTRAPHLDSADALLADLAGRRPGDPTVWGLWARVDLQRGDYAEAKAKADRSVWLRYGPARQ